MTAASAYPHEVPNDGAAALFAAGLRAHLPVLTTERCVLRAPELGDFAYYAEIMCSPRAVHMDGPMGRDEAYHDFTCAVAGWLLRGFGLWTVTLRKTGDVMGFVLVNMEPGDMEPELGFFLRHEAEGLGLAFEAAQAARDHATETLAMPALVSYIAQDNDRSILLAEKLGAARDDVAAKALDGETLVYRHAPWDEDGGMGAYA